MTQALTFGNDYLQLISRLVDTLEALRLKQSMIAQDSSLLGDKTVPTSYLAQTNARSDITSFDLGAASTEINKMIAFFDTGTPPATSTPAPSARLFKLL